MKQLNIDHFSWRNVKYNKAIKAGSRQQKHKRQQYLTIYHRSQQFNGDKKQYDLTNSCQ